jgi:hypothetical protein
MSIGVPLNVFLAVPVADAGYARDVGGDHTSADSRHLTITSKAAFTVVGISEDPVASVG